MGYILAVVVVSLVLLIWMLFSARSFEAEQKHRGRWDNLGPLIETEPPPEGLRGNRMSWRLEVVGRWTAKVIRRRQPGER
jgi:hypothetical protein